MNICNEINFRIDKLRTIIFQHRKIFFVFFLTCSLSEIWFSWIIAILSCFSNIRAQTSSSSDLSIFGSSSRILCSFHHQTQQVSRIGLSQSFLVEVKASWSESSKPILRSLDICLGTLFLLEGWTRTKTP